MKPENIKLPPQLMASGMMLIIVLFVVWVLMKRLGLIKTETQKKLEKETAENVKQLTSVEGVKLFDPALYKNSQYGYAYLVPQDQANKWADKIFDAFGFVNFSQKMIWDWFGDNEEQIYSVFRDITSQIQISQISDAYATRYSRDLLGDINSNLNDKEKSFLWNIIKNKPFAK